MALHRPRLISKTILQIKSSKSGLFFYYARCIQFLLFLVNFDIGVATQVYGDGLKRHQNEENKTQWKLKNMTTPEVSPSVA